MDSLFSFDNYRHYIADYINTKKQHNPNFSENTLSKICGFKSKNFINLIINNKRNISIKSALSLAKAFNLNTLEERFFVFLVNYNQSEDETERNFYHSNIEEIKKFVPHPPQVFNPDVFFNKWYLPLFLVLSNNQSKNDIILKMKKYGIEEAEVNEALSYALEKSFLIEKENVLFLCNTQIILKEKVKNDVCFKSFHMSQLEHGLRQFNKTYGDFGKCASHTFTINKDNFKYYKHLLDNTIEQIVGHSEASEASDCVQLNLHFFLHPEA